MLCIASAGAVTALAVSGFTLSWSHSVEHTRWQESWRVNEDRLQIVEAMVEGPGAGMEAPEGAVWSADGWRYTPTLPPLREVRLAASGMTDGGWTLCANDTCQVLGAEAGTEIVLTAAPICPGS